MYKIIKINKIKQIKVKINEIKIKLNISSETWKIIHNKLSIENNFRWDNVGRYFNFDAMF